MPSSAGLNEAFVAKIQYSVSVSTALKRSYVANDFLQSISGSILVYHENEKREMLAGYIRASLVQFGHALDHGITTDEMGDGIVAEYWEQIFDVDTGCWKEEVQQEFEIAGTDLLIIDRVEVYPDFRGQNIGLAAVDRTVDLFGGGCGLVACKPWPCSLLRGAFADWNRPRAIKRRHCAS